MKRHSTGQGQEGHSIKEKSTCKARGICISLAPKIEDLSPREEGESMVGKIGRKEQTCKLLWASFKKNFHEPLHLFFPRWCCHHMSSCVPMSSTHVLQSLHEGSEISCSVVTSRTVVLPQADISGWQNDGQGRNERMKRVNTYQLQLLKPKPFSSAQQGRSLGRAL